MSFAKKTSKTKGVVSSAEFSLVLGATPDPGKPREHSHYATVLTSRRASQLKFTHDPRTFIV